MQVNEQVYESLPQRRSGRGRKGAAAELGGAQQSPGVLAELGDRLGSTMNHLELQGSTESPAAVSRTLYRKDAEGDACYECEDSQHKFCIYLLYAQLTSHCHLSHRFPCLQTWITQQT